MSDMKLAVTRASLQRGLAFLTLSLIIFGCSTFDYRADKAQELIRNNKLDDVIKEFKEKAWKDSDDRLVYLFDYGMAAQIARNYEESTKALLIADQLSEVKDYHSVSRITGSLLLNEGMVQYKGDDYEKILVNAILAVNFLMQNQHDAALVETRKLNQKLYNYKYEAKKDYEQNPFAYYLAAMIWEADRKWDDAYIDYKKFQELLPNFPYINQDLYRTASLSQRTEDLKLLKKVYSEAESRKQWKDKNYGEIVLIYQQGWSPRKRPDPSSPRLPKLFPVKSRTTRAKMSIEGLGEERSQLVYSVQDTAMKTLGDQYAALAAKRLAGLVSKAVVADQVRQKNSALGDLAWIGMNILDRADTRQWSTLPETFQVARIWAKEGVHKVKVEGLNDAGAAAGEEMAPVEVFVKAGKKVFINWRSVR